MRLGETLRAGFFGWWTVGAVCIGLRLGGAVNFYVAICILSRHSLPVHCAQSNIKQHSNEQMADEGRRKSDATSTVAPRWPDCLRLLYFVFVSIALAATINCLCACEALK